MENLREEIKRIAGKETFAALEKYVQRAAGVGDPGSYNKALSILKKLKKSASAEDKKKIEGYIEALSEKYCNALFE